MIRSRWLSLAMLCVAALAVACGLPTSAPQPKPPARIGFLSITDPEQTPPTGLASFRDGMRERGYIEGEHFVLEVRFSRGREDLLYDQATELVRLGTDIIVTRGTPETLAARNATSTIPIVMGFASDPVGIGLVASLARPGGNVTGLASLTFSVGGKQLELLKEAFPRITRVAVFWPAANPAIAVDQLLRRAKPADLPVSQPLSAELGVNLRTAKEFDLTIPESILPPSH